MATLKDIAKATGISLTQVSRALNNHSDVSEATKEKVRQVAKEMGYIKNINAQRLAMKQSNQIAVIMHNVGDSDSEMSASLIIDKIKGVNTFATSVGYESVIHLVQGESVSYIDFCRERSIKGVILFGAHYNASNLKELVESDFPCVVIDIPIEGENKGCVVIDNVYYAGCAVNHLLEGGSQNIAMLNGNKKSMVSMERQKGYEQALQAHQVAINEELIQYCDFDFNKAYESTLNLVEKYQEIDGFFCASDLMAMACLKALQVKRKKVPQDITLFGFDGVAIGDYTNPPLSTVQQDSYQKGFLAAQMLYNILNGKKCEQMVAVPCHMKYKESSND